MAGARPPAPARARPRPAPAGSEPGGGGGVRVRRWKGEGAEGEGRSAGKGKDALEMRGYELGRSWGRQNHREGDADKMGIWVWKGRAGTEDGPEREVTVCLRRLAVPGREVGKDRRLEVCPKDGETEAAPPEGTGEACWELRGTAGSLRNLGSLEELREAAPGGGKSLMRGRVRCVGGR